MPYKYFTNELLDEALNGLRAVSSRWLLIPLVLAANGVNGAAPAQMRGVGRPGTDSLFERFFSLSKIGLPSPWNGKILFRPLFSDLTPDHESDKAKFQGVKLWANVFSQSGYPEWVDRGWIIRSGPNGVEWKLGPDFAAQLALNISPDFRFEHFLIWAYVFDGFPDQINTWEDLKTHFLQQHFVGGAYATEFETLLRLRDDVPWPNEFRESRLDVEELRLLLFPAFNAESVTPKDFKSAYEDLLERFKATLRGYSDAEMAELARNTVSSLQACKTVFLMGDPGTGKTEIAKMTVQAFASVFGTRLYTGTLPVLQSTTPVKLLGFSSLDGQWVDGALSGVEHATNRRLFYRREGKPPKLSSEARTQVNVFVLDEANRQDIEVLVGRLQLALDSRKTQHGDDDFRVLLDNAGEHFISPFTFFIFTGNSPKDDSGRMVQSRPQRRRQNVLGVPNVFGRVLTNANGDEFRDEIVHLWRASTPEIAIDSASAEKFSQQLSAGVERISAMRIFFQMLNDYAVGVTYGLVKKVLFTASAVFAITGDFGEAFDEGLTTAILAMLASETTRQGTSLRAAILGMRGTIQPYFPHLIAKVEEFVSDLDEFGRVKAFV